MGDILSSSDLEDCLQNEIQLLRSINHDALLELKGVYSDSKYFFLLFDKYEGDSLLRVTSCGEFLKEVQVASVFYS